MNGNLLANLIWLFHIGVVIFILLAPFARIPILLILHFSLCLTLIVHWWNSSDVCSLSILESQLRGIPYSDGFTHKFIAPMYNISATKWSRICWIITIILMSVSLYYLTKVDWKKIAKSKSWSEMALLLYSR